MIRLKRLLLCTSPLPHWPRLGGPAFWLRCRPSWPWSIAEPRGFSSIVQDDRPPSSVCYKDLVRMVEEGRHPQRLRGTGLSKDASATDYRYRSTLRGWSVGLASKAKHRDRTKGRQGTIDANDLLDLVLEQAGLCAYSGVPLDLLRPNSHWRASIERVDTQQGYLRHNCCLIAAEFNSSVNHIPDELSTGSAQWSKHKVGEVARIRAQPVRLQQLHEDLAHARLSPSFSRTANRFVGFRGPDAEGRWRCTQCGHWKPEASFYRVHASTSALRAQCKQCHSHAHSAYLKTARGHGLQLLSSARRRDSQSSWNGTFNLDLNNLLDMLCLQGGRCYYSGVPLHCSAGPADWAWSIERLDNSLTYTKENCVLIAQEFQTSDQSRNKARFPVFGTAQWSRSKARHVWGPYYSEDSRVLRARCMHVDRKAAPFECAIRASAGHLPCHAKQAREFQMYSPGNIRLLGNPMIGLPPLKSQRLTISNLQ